MTKKKPDDGDAAAAALQAAAPTPPPRPTSDDLTTAEILAQSPPAKPRAPAKRETAKSLGVYDADRDILDQYLFEVSKTPLLTAPAGDRHRPAGPRRATTRPCRSWSSATSASSSRWPRSTRTAGWRSPT